MKLFTKDLKKTEVLLKEERDKSNKLERELQESKKKAELLENKLEKAKLYLAKYKEMMEEAVSDCQIIVSKEKNEVKKQEYKKIQEAYEAQIEEIKHTINSWK